MTETLKIRKVGNSLGLILSQATLKSLNLEEGDQLYMVQTPEGLMLTPYDPEFAETLSDARDFMKSHRDAFKTLAK